MSNLFLQMVVIYFLAYGTTLLLVQGEEDEEEDAAKSNDTSQEDSEELRGLRGSNNPLQSLQKGMDKCAVVGNYGIANECSKYMECRKIGTVSATKYCPSGRFFDYYKRVCVASGLASCKKSCGRDGQLFVDATNPSGFLRCAKGIPMPYPCPAGQVFNPTKLACGAKGKNNEER